jgi:hypothetical protein
MSSWQGESNEATRSEMGAYLGRTSQSVATLSDGDVQDKLLDFDVPHGVLHLLLRRLHRTAPKPKTLIVRPKTKP